ncbi:right-handed parallel beta-helix repeat-containing protein [Actinocorallia sp. B10E7]|uniref:right-handed parallel beta-helix repeat-containing protein n=1 Tax=Actinocorallia sp. B10E7 TaxID=3153558 RepID=UPI00325C966A
MKIDVKFLAGLLVGVLATMLVVGLTMGGSSDSETPRIEPLGPAGSEPVPGPADGEDEEVEVDAGDGEEFKAVEEPPTTPVPSSGEGRISCPEPTVTVSSALELVEALEAAGPGTVIKLAPGVYQGRFVATTTGTKEKPIFVCGEKESIIDGGGVKKGYAFHLDDVSHWRLVGFTVRHSQKGVMADKTNDTIIQDLAVHHIGDEAIHLRNFSSRNTVQYNLIYATGLRREKFGEGVYLGSAESNWEQFSGGKMDRSDENTVRGNVIRATAEAIDIKEGTSNGRIIGNVFDGSKLGGSKHNDSWVDVKGNGYLIEGNQGAGTNADGFQTHQIVEGWGTGNVFRGNVIDLGDSGGVGINDTVGGNTIACDNKVTGGPLTKKDGCS